MTKLTNPIKKVGLFATPNDMKSFQDYLSKFALVEGAVAQTAAWMAWNLASQYVDKMLEAVEPKTFFSYAVTCATIVRFYPDVETASKWQLEHPMKGGTLPSLTKRYFRLDDEIVDPNNCRVASYDEVELHIEKDKYIDQPTANFH